MAMKDTGAWTRQNIALERAKEQRRTEECERAISGVDDSLPAGITPEEMKRQGWENVPGDGWDAYEVNT